VAGSLMQISNTWDNLGVAPPYRDHRIALRLRDNANKLFAITITTQSIKGWLPGSRSATIQYQLPANLPAGIYTIETALVFHSAMDRTIPIAIKGKLSDSWYPMGKLIITTTTGVSDYLFSHKNIEIYPNPMVTEFTIKIPEATVLKDAVIKLYDLFGKEVKVMSLNSYETTLPTYELPAGLYFYSVLNNKENVACGKLVIQ
ncbi:MAG: T9SS type A sorting domain-containing protein, partial [Bacteroidetes bacterium]|nr:T9SS type A sorting domain-containing protein [Bacteroidota bacterium]